MSRLQVDPRARHPLYPGAMPLIDVRPGVQFVTLDTRRGTFALTALASEWRAESVSIISSIGRPLQSVIRLYAEDTNSETVDLCDKGIHPPVEASEHWNLRRISVLTSRDAILKFYPWLVREGFARAASEIEDTFFEYFVDSKTFWNQLLQADT